MAAQSDHFTMLGRREGRRKGGEASTRTYVFSQPQSHLMGSKGDGVSKKQKGTGIQTNNKTIANKTKEKENK